MKRAAIWTLALAVALGLAPYANAQAPKTETPKAGADKAEKISSADRNFIMKAASGGKAEVELGRLAGEKGSSEAVKKFGQRMVTDHGKAGEELAQLAQQKGIALPADMDAKHKKLVEKMSKLSGAEFDRTYIQEMKKDHDEDVKDFERQARNAKDADVKAWAAKTLPTLQEHQREINQMAASAGKRGASASPKSSTK
jgi:putative membrane protein